ncbi:sigma-54-dependent Fis family transcriptional regulator [candidate division KSB1 bacterium]|nr:sigma-54-dependent Fis family transcriptional regulator [candidate division KSB1 bacterium]NIR71715.1 sigma-54-dependent Fis family transcriptional regulator [candidate division KSB1 bacterium]NIS28262.1 sigma-54-dependent Fis family transcriptional regulator [candidate division KSB1 bacterium]NIT70392.1 sigma-54-dependent Fis family transcriptional regulator [candidate division KSB1 bacterium]NIU28940.1 sigma-54-dependent Fis family transcriptional regulator [candidate division KSB1 bacteri
MLQNRTTLLIADDDANFRNIVSNRLVRRNYHVAMADNGNQAIRLCREHNFDVALVDLRLPDISGIELLRELKGLDAKLEIVIMTGYPSVDTAVEAMSTGAIHYLKKPFQLRDLEELLGKIKEQHEKTDAQDRPLTSGPKPYDHFQEEIVGRSKAIEHVRRLIEKVVDSDAPVLIQGESGSGKELVARALHHRSKRANDAFVTINCAALQETLLESEIFGHVKGAFTGAIKDKRGLFEVANNGTLFIDEIGEMSPNLQSKLLRALDSGEFRRVGDTRNISAKVRLVTATNKNLATEVQNGSFREDLFFRINVITIKIPPLRERKEDIPNLVYSFLEKYSAKVGEKKEITPAALELLWHYDWPGNVRELFNVLERAIVLAPENLIGEEDLPSIISNQNPKTKHRSEITPLIELEKNQILLALNVENGNRTKAAAALGVSRRQLYRLMRKHNIF